MTEMEMEKINNWGCQLEWIDSDTLFGFIVSGVESSGSTGVSWLVSYTPPIW